MSLDLLTVPINNSNFFFLTAQWHYYFHRDSKCNLLSNVYSASFDFRNLSSYFSTSTRTVYNHVAGATRKLSTRGRDVFLWGQYMENILKEEKFLRLIFRDIIYFAFFCSLRNIVQRQWTLFAINIFFTFLLKTVFKKCSA